MDLECMSFVGAAKHEKKMLAYHGLCFLRLLFSFLQPGAETFILFVCFIDFIALHSGQQLWSCCCCLHSMGLFLKIGMSWQGSR